MPQRHQMPSLESDSRLLSKHGCFHLVHQLLEDVKSPFLSFKFSGSCVGGHIYCGAAEEKGNDPVVLWNCVVDRWYIHEFGCLHSDRYDGVQADLVGAGWRGLVQQKRAIRM